MNKTKIEYLTHSWSPIKMRCTQVSAGCANCWHLAMAKRLAKNPLLDEGVRAAYAGGIPALDNKELGAPLRLRKSARIGVQFMGDYFVLPLALQAPVLNIIHRANWHKYFFLTKRIEQMDIFQYVCGGLDSDHIWLGVSVENQKTADERIPILLQIPAAHHWVSYEPALGPLQFNHHWVGACDSEDHQKHNFISFLVCGGETGPHARPLHPDWVRSVRDQCQTAGVSFFFKSWGTPRFPNIDISDWVSAGYNPIDIRSRGNNILDGREYKEIP